MIKKVLAIITCIIIVVPCLLTEVSAYSAVSYCLYDPVCDKVIASSNMDEKMPMASTTKIMTALLTCELRDLNHKVKITKPMITVEGSSVGLQVGDEISAECLLYGMMLESGNDAALSLAIDISGSQEAFAKLMNKKALQLGMKNTNFVTPNGLDDEKHYSTAYDMAILAGYAMKNSMFKKIVGTQKFKAAYNNNNSFRTYYNHNKLLRILKGAEGVKTGFTKKSGRCLVSSCKRYGIRLIAVTLKAGDDWTDHKMLYDFGYEQYQKVTLPEKFKIIKIAGSNANEIVVKSNKVDIYFYNGLYSSIKEKFFVPKFLYAPIKKGDVIGHIEYSYNNNVVATATIKATKTINKAPVKTSTFSEKLKKYYIMLISIK